MLCNDCGKPVEEGQEFCPECLAARQAACADDTPSEQVVSDSESIPAQETAPVKKEKRRLIAVLAAAALTVIAAVVLALNWYNWFYAPQAHLIQAETAALRQIFQAMHREIPAPALDTDHTSRTVTLELSEDATTALSKMVSGPGPRLDLDWLHSIVLQTNVDESELLTQTELAVGLNDTRIISLQVIGDVANNIGYLRVPEMSDTYLRTGLGSVDVYSLFQTPTVDAAALQALMDKLPDADEMTRIANKYLSLFFSQPDTVKRTTETVTIEGISQTMTVLTVTMDATQFRDACIAVLEAAQEDMQLKQIVGVFLECIQQMYGQDSAAAVYAGIPTAEEVWKQIPATIAQYKNMPTSTQPALTYRVYVDSQNNVYGRSFAAPKDNESWSFLCLGNANHFAVEFRQDNAYEKLTVTGSGNLETSSFRMCIDGQPVACVDVLSLDMAAMQQGELMGTFRIYPSEEFWNEMKTGLQGSPIAELWGDTMPEIQLVYSSACMEMTLQAGQKMIARVTTELKEKEAEQVSIPTDAMDANDPRFDATVDLEGVWENLRAAGMPQEYVDALRQQWEAMLTAMQGPVQGDLAA